MKKKKSIISIISVIMLLILVVGIIGAWGYLSQNKNINNLDFSVVLNKTSLKNGEDFYFEPNETLTFYPKYVSDILPTNKKDYTVKIVPNPEKEIYLICEEEEYLYSQIEDLSSAFQLKKELNHFKITANPNFNNIVSTAIEVEVLLKGLLDIKYNYFLLKVTSYDEKTTITIPFRCYLKATGIELSQENIVI